jgi:hypothetical protein
LRLGTSDTPTARDLTGKSLAIAIIRTAAQFGSAVLVIAQVASWPSQKALF